MRPLQAGGSPGSANAASSQERFTLKEASEAACANPNLLEFYIRWEWKGSPPRDNPALLYRYTPQIVQALNLLCWKLRGVLRSSDLWNERAASRAVPV